MAAAAIADATAWLEAAVQDHVFVTAVVNAVLYTSLPIFVLLQFVTAPFGRHAEGVRRARRPTPGMLRSPHPGRSRTTRRNC